jgi:hypothetical protein
LIKFNLTANGSLDVVTVVEGSEANITAFFDPKIKQIGFYVDGNG